MTHELKNIFEHYQNAQKKGLKAVLATVVDLDGSSYRRPGVRMLIFDNGNIVGAVSGGCVEKEIIRQSEDVFQTNNSKLITYDGRYRLGCEGILYIILEAFRPDVSLIRAFRKCIEDRSDFEVISFYERKEGSTPGIGSTIKFSDNSKFLFSGENYPATNGHNSLLSSFTQKMNPCIKLIIIGSEHDAVQLCLFASLAGWEVTVISSPDDPKNIADFPGAKVLYAQSSDDFSNLKIDELTAIVVMTHNFVNDLKYLIAMRTIEPVYLGLLGPIERREKLLSQLMERHPDINESFVDCIHGPAGINIGSETPQEIAISIISEILAVIRDHEPIKLSQKYGRIHS